MNEAKIRTILSLLPLAERLLFDVGGKLIELNTAGIKSPEDLKAAIEKSKSTGWPELKFVSSEDPETGS